MLWDAFFRRVRWERRLDAEMRFHIEQQVRDDVAQGLSREEAQRKAYREFGGIELSKEECRDQTPFLWLEHAIQDIRYALRLLIRNRTLAYWRFCLWRWVSGPLHRSSAWWIGFCFAVYRMATRTGWFRLALAPPCFPTISCSGRAISNFAGTRRPSRQ